MFSSSLRFATASLLAITLFAPGCKKGDQAPAAGSGSGSGSAAPVTPTAPPPVDAAVAAKPAADTTSVATVAALDAFVLPAPKTDAPADAAWQQQESTKVGNRLAYFGKGPDAWIDLEILDCNLPRMQENAKKPAGERSGDAPYCLDPMDGKLKDYPMLTKYSSVRAIKVGHIVFIATVGGKSSGKMKDSDLEAYLGSIDMSQMDKLTAPVSAEAAANSVAVKHDGGDEGPFDGTKAVYIKHGDDRMVVIPANCAAFTCEGAGADGMGAKKLWTDCPSVKLLVLTLNGSSQPGEPKVGPTKAQGYVGGASSGHGLTSDWTAGVTLGEVAADHITGKIDMKDGTEEAHGSFTAKACP